ncbi:MAG: nucleotidyltransferase family protein [Lautropia sp.]|nr:nucleotidyltransferase family protein [Lautropia sp.]
MVRPSAILDANRQAVREAVSRYRTTNPRVFGSVLHGTDHEDSDIDILVDTLPGATLLDLGGLYGELEDILGVKVDLLTLAELPEKRRAKILAEAQPI